MKAYVVTLDKMIESVDAAIRCIKSANEYGIHPEMYSATTKYESVEKAKKYKLKIRDFDRSWSVFEAALGNFVTQYELWHKAAKSNELTLILEHDALFTAPLPEFEFDTIISIGIPSFGAFKTKPPGVHKSFSKPGGYLPGAHAYIINSIGAQELIRVAQTKGMLPCDIFLNIEDFPNIQELSPGIVKADDSFTTIQVQKGCLAKHSYNEEYKILT